VTQPIRFLFDECAIGRGTVERELRDLLALFGADGELAHLLTKFPPGTPDSVWIPEIANEGGWIVVSSDRGAHSKKSEKLPLICQEMRVTYVMLSRAIQKRPTHCRVMAINSCWQQLIDAAGAAPGTGFSILIRTAKGGTDSFRFQKIYDPSTAEKSESIDPGKLF
jgi:hypothetical protein